MSISETLRKKESKKMKKWFKKVKDWFYWNSGVIAVIATIAGVVLLIAALVVALIIGISAGNSDDMSKEMAWLINPANPASPIHLLP
jgi:uncharacterized protein involved in cysteine biosynthesis